MNGLLLYILLLLQAMAVQPIPMRFLVIILHLAQFSSVHAGAYYGIKQMPQQHAPMQQIPHIPMSKEGIPMQHLGKEMAHLQYGKEIPIIPQYRKEIPQMPLHMGKEIPRKEFKASQL